MDMMCRPRGYLEAGLEFVDFRRLQLLQRPRAGIQQLLVTFKRAQGPSISTGGSNKPAGAEIKIPKSAAKK